MTATVKSIRIDNGYRNDFTGMIESEEYMMNDGGSVYQECDNATAQKKGMPTWAKVLIGAAVILVLTVFWGGGLLAIGGLIVGVIGAIVAVLVAAVVIGLPLFIIIMTGLILFFIPFI